MVTVEADQVRIRYQVADRGDFELHIEFIQITDPLQLPLHDLLDGLDRVRFNDMLIHKPLNQQYGEFRRHFTGSFQEITALPLALAVNGINGFIGGAAWVHVACHGKYPHVFFEESVYIYKLFSQCAI